MQVGAAVALAHGTTIPHDLAGVAPCVDEASIDVRIERGGEAAERAVRERLERALDRTLTSSAVPWHRGAPCPDGVDYLSVVLVVESAPWFAPRASAYELAVQVGARASADDGTVRAYPPAAFDLAVRELFDERAVGVPAVVFLPRYVEAGLRDLSVSWWEDHVTSLAASGGARWLPPVAGSALAVLVAAAAWWATARWRTSPAGSAGLRRLGPRAEEVVRDRPARQQRERRRPDQADAEGERAEQDRAGDRQLHQQEREQDRQ